MYSPSRQLFIVMGDDRKVFARRGRGFPRGNRGHSGFRGRGRGGFRSRGHNRGSGMNHSEYNSSRAYSSLAGPRLAEFDVGITEFISKLSGFSAVLKHRCEIVVVVAISLWMH